MERQSRVRLIRQGFSPIKILRRLLDSDVMAFEKQWVCPECDGHGRRPPENPEGFGGPYYCFPCHNKGWMTRKEKHKYENPRPYWENMLIPRKEKRELKQKHEAERAEYDRSLSWRNMKTNRQKPKSKKRVKKLGPQAIDEGNQLKVGDLVKHPSFGKGVVVNICGSGMSVEATIEFANHGKKHLAVAWAQLKKVK